MLINVDWSVYSVNWSEAGKCQKMRGALKKYPDSDGAMS